MKFLRGQDVVWLLLFGALHWFSPAEGDAELETLVALAAFQLISGRVKWFSTPVGNLVSIGAKLLLGWLLIGVTFGVSSSYYLILLMPVVSAATTLGGWQTALVTAAAIASYLSFLLFLDPSQHELTFEGLRELALRCSFLPVVGYLTYQLARANRAEVERYQATAAELEKANLNLHAAEEAVRRADRLAALGQLTAGLAHELRNPLGTVKNSAELLSRRVPESDAVGRELAGFISSEVDRANSLVTRFLEFARPLRLQLRPVAAADLLDRVIAQQERGNPETAVDVFKNYSPDVRPIPMDAELMERVFSNLLANAADASPPGGVVTVKTRQADGGVEISFIDRGPGIAPAHRENIFNPFFTTKTKGVGLGLAIVTKIVDEHGGKVLVDSTPGEGSVFRVWLPAGS